MEHTQDEIYIKFLDTLNSKFDPNQNYPGAYIKAELNAQKARVETKLTIYNINWVKLFTALIGICSLPAIIILLGFYVMGMATAYNNAYQAGLISAPVGNETIVTFVIITIAVIIICTGIIILRLNSLYLNYRNSDFIKSKVN